jgi:hypothetical protein
MNDVFELIGNGIIFSWDPEEISKDFKVISNKGNNVITLPNKEPHWQYFDSGIYFSRNLNHAFPSLCKEILKTLMVVQNNVKALPNKSSMMKLFADHKLNIDRILLVKVKSGQSVNLHFDSTRDYAINIGLKNSNTCLTDIYSGDKVEHLLINEKNTKHTFQMNDGDAYLIATCQPHAVRSLTSINDNVDRYIISYCL